MNGNKEALSRINIQNKFSLTSKRQNRVAKKAGQKLGFKDRIKIVRIVTKWLLHDNKVAVRLHPVAKDVELYCGHSASELNTWNSSEYTKRLPFPVPAVIFEPLEKFIYRMVISQFNSSARQMYVNAYLEQIFSALNFEASDNPSEFLKKYEFYDVTVDSPEHEEEDDDDYEDDDD